MALQEIRWKDAGVIEKKDYALFYSGTPGRSGQKGTGFCVNRKIRNNVLGFEPINERICKLRIKKKFNNLSLICVYAPTEANDESETELFYHILESVCDKTNKYDTLIILGGFNAKVGKESFVQAVASMYSLHDETSPNGLTLCQWTENSLLRIMSTAFQHKNIHRGTWKMPGGEVTNQIWFI